MQGTRALCGAQSSNMAPNNHECFFPPLHFFFFFFFRSADRRELPINERTRHACCRRFFFPFSNNFFFFFSVSESKRTISPSLRPHHLFRQAGGWKGVASWEMNTHTIRLLLRVVHAPFASSCFLPAYRQPNPARIHPISPQPAASRQPVPNLYLAPFFFKSAPVSLSLSFKKSKRKIYFIICLGLYNKGELKGRSCFVTP